MVLERLALEFEAGRRYSETEVNEILGTFHEDYASLRRYLVDEGLLDRAEGQYWRAGGRAREAGLLTSVNPDAHTLDGLTDLGLDVRGLMTIGPPGPPEEARPAFRLVRSLADKHGLAEVSMGMTGDLGVAVEEGATMVRVGTALFGPRPQRAGMRH